MSYRVCAVCGRNLVTINKPGIPPFQGCSMWDAEHQKAKEAYKAAKNQNKPVPQPPQGSQQQGNSLANQLLVEEIQGLRKEFNDRLDKLGEYLVKKLG